MAITKRRFCPEKLGGSEAIGSPPLELKFHRESSRDKSSVASVAVLFKIGRTRIGRLRSSGQRWGTRSPGNWSGLSRSRLKKFPFRGYVPSPLTGTICVHIVGSRSCASLRFRGSKSHA